MRVPQANHAPLLGRSLGAAAALLVVVASIAPAYADDAPAPADNTAIFADAHASTSGSADASAWGSARASTSGSARASAWGSARASATDVQADARAVVPGYLCDTAYAIGSEVRGVRRCAASGGAPANGAIPPPYEIHGLVGGGWTCAGTGAAAVPLFVGGTECVRK
ncbi:hypothetical protein ACIBEJ_16780 [Nonomuraea sp. NPDC050790]|uniref:hypothetical protein n=1 Tax=Nonomuraea sp. NPDC050790 TaxID=3364371 RepID=UPI0037B8B39F